jgi:hypothetical protein
MHQDAANRVRSEAARLVPSTVYALVMPIAADFSR